jgi:soluble lytic murein transglycosylase
MGMPLSALRAQAPIDSTTALVLAARAYDRAKQLDSARADYETAAGRLPALADWLRLRAAAVTADSAKRAADYAAVTNPAATARIAWTEAEARERTGDLLGAARAYGALGARLDALRDSAAALATDSTDTTRTALCGRLFGLVADRSGTAEARALIEIIDVSCPTPSLPLELAIARSAAASGPVARAATGFDRVVAAMSLDSLSSHDVFLYGTVLARVHRDADAARVFAVLAARPAVVTPTALIYGALYQRARALVASGDRTTARQTLRDLLRAAPRDTASATAGMLLADLATDDRDDAAARRAFLEVARRFPRSVWAARAAFRAALVAFVLGSPAEAGHEWDALVARYPHSEDSTAARYWAGRSWARVGKRSLAATRWRRVLKTDPLSYYAILSARRLHVSPPIDRIERDSVVNALAPGVDSGIARAAELENLGMSLEAKFEVDYAIQAAGMSPGDLTAVGAALARVGEASRTVAVGWRLVDATDTAWRDPRVLRLIYPLAYVDTLVEAAHQQGLDPALVAAIVRQESAFNPHAVSVAGARGLMQIMPSVARGLAVSRRLNVADPGLLDQPGVNLTFGAAHFATFLTQEDGDLVRTLAAYNAGPSRVAAWATKRGVDDPEVFVERIPFAETRDYVRAILRGREMYARLYNL